MVVVPTGELHLVEALVAYRAGLAGEGNGGVVVPEVGIARDGLAAAAVVLELVARAGRPLARIADELPRLARVRSTLRVGGRRGRARDSSGGRAPPRQRPWSRMRGSASASSGRTARGASFASPAPSRWFA